MPSSAVASEPLLTSNTPASAVGLLGSGSAGEAEPGNGTGSASPHCRMRAVPKVREAIKLIETDGWQEVTTKGSHRQFKHPTKTGRVTIAGKPSDDLAPGTYNSILKQAGLKG